MNHVMRGAISRVAGTLRNAVLSVATGALLCLSSPIAFGADAPPCAANPNSRQFDFWLGDWAVTYPGAPGGSTSTVSLTLDQCVVVENWNGGKGHSGRNWFAYSADDQAWHGMFADNRGRVHVFEGALEPGAAEFRGPSRNADGTTVLNRVRVVRINADQVEESWEKSTDQGKTWKTEFRGEYHRKQP
jgi:hypothetical protein